MHVPEVVREHRALTERYHYYCLHILWLVPLSFLVGFAGCVKSWFTEWSPNDGLIEDLPFWIPFRALIVGAKLAIPLFIIAHLTVWALRAIDLRNATRRAMDLDRHEADDRARDEREAALRSAEEARRAQEAKQRREKKYNWIINCPECRGAGEMIIVERFNGFASADRQWKYEPNDDPNDWSLHGKRSFIGPMDPIEMQALGIDQPGGSVEYYREQCPYCLGEKTALAYFESSGHGRCRHCGGSGSCCGSEAGDVRTNGSASQAPQQCEMCYGMGETADILHYRTIVSPSRRLSGSLGKNVPPDHGKEAKVVMDDATRTSIGRPRPRFAESAPDVDRK